VYQSDLNYPVGVIDPIMLSDPARGNYTIPLLIRYPIGAVGRRPVVIWNHGGNPSPQGRQRSAEWGNTLAAAGYVVIHPSRVLIQNAAPFQAECQANGFGDPATCAYWVTQFRYGSQNTTFLIDNLAQIEAASPALAGRLDPRRIVVAGHSAGSGVVLANAGAWQKWTPTGPTYTERYTRVIAFLASGVQGPMYAGFSSGFQPDSFLGIARPFMFITGIGDETGEPSTARTTAWLSSRAGSKLLLWDTSAGAVHETMDIHKCDTPARSDHCRWIASAGLAYLDAIVRGRSQAQRWLASPAMAALSGGAIELHQR
jgi:hypothetical protein